MINLAACQYAIERLSSWEAYTSKIESLVAYSKKQGAELLLLPEYAGIEIVTTQTDSDLALFNQIQPLLPRYLAFYQQLAQRYQIYIQPGTILVEKTAHQFNNRAYFFGPSGSFGYQDKLQLVADEKEGLLLQPGIEQMLFKTSLGIIGIAICYDCEFPEIVRHLVVQGAKLILVPSYTPSKESFKRVFYSCRARAIENQCYVLMSSVVGPVLFAQTNENVTGQANFFTPIDEHFSEEGILSQGKLNDIAIISGAICYQKLDQVRQHGQVHNFHDFLATGVKSQQMTKTNLSFVEI